MIRFYFVPIEQVGAARGPEYFHWRFDDELVPELAGVQWNMIDYGLINQGIVAANVTTAQHTYLSAQTGVLAVPVDLDANLTGGQITALNNYLEGINVPADWLAGGTVREGLRTVTAMYQYMQRLTTITNTSPFDIVGISLNATMSTVALNNYAAFKASFESYLASTPNENQAWSQARADAITAGLSEANVWRMTFMLAAETMGYDVSFVTAGTTLRQFLKNMADQWEDRPINFGLTTL